MRKQLIALFLITLVNMIPGCQKEVKQGEESPATLSTPDPNSVNCSLSCPDYQVAMQRTYANGQTTFIWTITNPCPGNGQNGTLQDLSHWVMVPGQCLVDNFADLVEVAYNQGAGWIVFNPMPTLEPDQSMVNQGCITGNVLKFNAGTNGATPTSYRVILDGNWGTDNLSLFFKSGGITGCCAASFTGLGIGCPENTNCSYSQGYWFASNPQHPNGIHPWNGTVTIGGHTYTNAEGLAIWKSSNAGGIKHSKKAFLQLASLKLSGTDLTDPDIAGYVNTIECWLGSIAKLSPAYLPNQSPASIGACGNASNAAGQIGDGISDNHCE